MIPAATSDISEIPAFAAFGMRITGMFNRNAKGLEETLRRLQARFHPNE